MQRQSQNRNSSNGGKPVVSPTSVMDESKNNYKRSNDDDDDDDDNKKAGFVGGGDATRILAFGSLFVVIVLAVVTLTGNADTSLQGQQRVQSLYYQSGSSITRPTKSRVRADPLSTATYVKNINHAADDDNSCSVWMAPSSVKGLKGYGIFVTRDIPYGGKILNGPDGVSIPIIKYSQKLVPDNAHSKKHWVHLWNNYWWGRGVPDHVSFEAPTDLVDYAINFGALPNHHCVLDSLDAKYMDDPYQDQLVHTAGSANDQFYDNPATGAFTYDLGREFVVEKHVYAGDELFLNYGHCYEHTHDPDWTDFVVMKPEYKQAVQIVRQSTKNGGGLKYNRMGKNLDIKALQKAYNNTVSDLTLSILPTTQAERTSLMAISSDKALMEQLAEKTLNRRTPEWIKENGMCLENLTPKPSIDIPQAGHGAFAQFGIKKGELVVPAPMLHIMDKKALDLYDYSVGYRGSSTGQNPEKVGTQLLLNYCFGHKESTLLMCPNTNAILINHCSTRAPELCNNKTPNAFYRWSSGWDPSSDKWRKYSLDELEQENGRGLSIEVIALRDIAPGEEVYMDYGVEWEQAWKNHVANYKPLLSKPAGPWMPAHDANIALRNDGVPDFLISNDIRKVKEHSHLMVGCHYWATSIDKHEVYKQTSPDWTTWKDTKILETFADDGRDFKYYKAGGYKSHQDQSHWPCAVLKEEEGKGRDGEKYYTVRILPNPYYGQQPWDKNDVPRLLYRYPKSSMHIFVKPHETDQQLPGVFRHEMMFKDDLFPNQWRNLKQ